MEISNGLYNQLAMKKGLHGKALEDYVKKLANMEEEELQKELHNYFFSNYEEENDGFKIEHSVVEIKQPQIVWDTKTYRDSYGNDVTEYFDKNNELISKVIVNKDSKGNTIESTIEYEDGKIQTKRIKLNGNTTNTITYTYEKLEEDNELITVKNKKSDKTEEITSTMYVDADGEIYPLAVLSRETTLPDGSKKGVYLTEKGVIEIVENSQRKVTTLYNCGNMAVYDNSKPAKLAECIETKNGEQYYAEYDGNGNTVTYVQSGESIGQIAAKFNKETNYTGAREGDITEGTITALEANQNREGDEKLTQVGATVIIPGEYPADCAALKGRLSKEYAVAQYHLDKAQDKYNKFVKDGRLVKKITVKNSYKDIISLAKSLLPKDASEGKVWEKVYELMALNSWNSPNIEIKKGTKITVIDYKTEKAIRDQKTQQNNLRKRYAKYGFNDDDFGSSFITQYDKLSTQDKKKVEDALERFKRLNGNKVSWYPFCKDLYETYQINLFPTKKSIPLDSFSNWKIHKSVPLEIFLTDKFNLDITKGNGKEAYLRLASLSQDQLNTINLNWTYNQSGRIPLLDYIEKRNPNLVQDLSKAPLEDISSAIFGMTKVDIRTQEEISKAQRINPNKQRHIQETKGREFAALMLADLFENAANELNQYRNSFKENPVSWLGERLNAIVNLLTVPVSGGFDGDINWIDGSASLEIKFRRMSDNFRKLYLSASDHETFDKKFKEYLGGYEFKLENMQDLQTLIQTGPPAENSDYNVHDKKKEYEINYKLACNKAFGWKLNYAEQYIDEANSIYGLGNIAADIYLMSQTFGLSSVATATKYTAESTFKFGSKFLGKKGAERFSRIATSSITGGNVMGSYFFAKNTGSFLLTPTSDLTSLDEWEEVVFKPTVKSWGFGVVGGFLGATVVNPIVTRIINPSQKAVNSVTRLLNENAEVTGKEIMETAFKSQEFKLSGLFKLSGAELKDFIRTLFAQNVVSLGLNVAGFTVYESTLDTLFALCGDGSTKSNLENALLKIAPDKYTKAQLQEMDWTTLIKDYLTEKLKEQAVNLTTISSISGIVGMIMGGKAAPTAMHNELLKQCEKLSNLKVQKVTNIPGRSGYMLEGGIKANEYYVITKPNGEKVVAPSQEAVVSQIIGYCETFMQVELMYNSWLKDFEEDINYKTKEYEQTTRPRLGQEIQDVEAVEVKNEPIGTKEGVNQGVNQGAKGTKSETETKPEAESQGAKAPEKMTVSNRKNTQIVNNITYNDLTQKLLQTGVEAEVYELQNGQKIIKVKSGMLGRKHDYYVFNSDGGMIEYRFDIDKNEAKTHFNLTGLKPTTIKPNRGTLSMGGLGDLTEKANAQSAYKTIKETFVNGGSTVVQTLYGPLEYSKTTTHDGQVTSSLVVSRQSGVTIDILKGIPQETLQSPVMEHVHQVQCSTINPEVGIIITQNESKPVLARKITTEGTLENCLVENNSNNIPLKYDVETGSMYADTPWNPGRQDITGHCLQVTYGTVVEAWGARPEYIKEYAHPETGEAPDVGTLAAQKESADRSFMPADIAGKQYEIVTESGERIPCNYEDMVPGVDYKISKKSGVELKMAVPPADVTSSEGETLPAGKLYMVDSDGHFYNGNPIKRIKSGEVNWNADMNDPVQAKIKGLIDESLKLEADSKAAKQAGDVALSNELSDRAKQVTAKAEQEMTDWVRTAQNKKGVDFFKNQNVSNSTNQGTISQAQEIIAGSKASEAKEQNIDIFDRNKMTVVLKSFGFEDKDGLLIANEALTDEISEIRRIGGPVPQIILYKEDLDIMHKMINMGDHKDFWQSLNKAEFITIYLRFKNLFSFYNPTIIELKGEKFWDKIIDNLQNNVPTEDERDALGHFVGDGSNYINGALTHQKEGKSVSEFWLKQADLLAQLINKHALDEDTQLTRVERNINRFSEVVLSDGTTLTDVLMNFDKYKDRLDEINAELSGMTIQNERFMSATAREGNSPMQGLEWEINLPKGSKAIFRNTYTDVNNHEIEYIIQKGSTIVIKGIKLDWRGNPVLVTEVRTNDVEGIKSEVETSQTTRQDGKVISPEDPTTIELSSKNPAQLAETKVKEEWRQHDLRAKAQEANEPVIISKDGKAVLNEEAVARQLNEPFPAISGEVTSLIFSGKLGEELTKRYEAASDFFNNVLQKHKSEIQQLAIEHKDNPQAFAQKIVNILCEEFGMKGLESKVVIGDGANMSADSNFDWTENQIEISDKITDFNKIAELVSHEFNHLLQLADIVAQYGKDGISDLLSQNKLFAESKNLSPEQKAELVDLCINSEYNQKLVEHVKSKRAEEGSLNDYLRRIYREEVTNIVRSKDPGYSEQLTENEAYFIGNKNGKVLGITELVTEEQFAKLKQENPNIQVTTEGLVYQINDDGTVTKLGIKSSTALIETEFETMDPEAAEKIIYNSIIHNSEENVEKFHGQIYPKSLLSYCEIDGKVCKELVDIASELLLKYDLGAEYKVMTIMDLFKTQSGIDRLAINKFKELSTGDAGKDEDIAHKLRSCRDSQGRFREDYYSKSQQIGSTDDKYAFWIIDSCKVNGYLDESIWAKALELKALGFSTNDIHSLITCCRSTLSNFEIDNFSEELYKKVLDLKQNHNIPNGEIYQIIENCKTKDGTLSEEMYNFAIELSTHIDTGIGDCVRNLIRVENKEELFNRLDEMKNKYGIKKDYDGLFELSCDIIQDGKVITERPFGMKQEYTLRFNKDKFERVMNLASELKMNSFQLRSLIKYCYKNGEFDDVVYNTILKLNSVGLNGSDLYLIGDCIYDRDGSSPSTVNYKLLENLEQWFTSYVRIKSAQEPQKDINLIKSNAEYFIRRMVGKINNNECEATEYIQKFIDAGLIDNIGEILEVASIRGENGNYTQECHYNAKVMDKMLSLQNKYQLNSGDVEKAISLMNNHYVVKNLSSEDKIKYLDSLDKLLGAGSSPKDVLEQIKNAELGFELNMIDLPEIIDMYERYMKQGHSIRTIGIVENFSSRVEKYKDNPEKFIDNAFSFINSLPEHMQKYILTLCHLEEWSDIITETVKQNNNESFIQEYMDMLQYQIATYDIDTPEFRKNVIKILEYVKEHPDKLHEIEILLRRTEHDYEMLGVCLKYPDRYEEIFETQHPLKTKTQIQQESIDNNPEDVSPRARYASPRSKYLIVQLDKAGLPLDEIIKIVDTITLGNSYDASRLTPEKVVDKIVELYQNKKLDMDIINVIKRYEHSEKLTGLIDYILGLKENNVIQFNSSEGQELAQLMSPPNGYEIYDNYKEIIDFYIKLKNENIELYNSIKNEEDSRLVYILNACGSSEQNSRYPNSLNVDVMQKIVDYVKLGINSDMIHLYCYGGGPYGYNYENMKNFVEFLDKVDMSEYKDAIIAILDPSSHSKKEAIVNPTLTKKSLDFILDIQKLLLNSEHINEPQILDNNFISVFKDKDITDDVYNKIRFYIESAISMYGMDMGKFNATDVAGYARAIINYPKKADYLESLFIDAHDDAVNTFWRLSQDKEIAEKQIELCERLRTILHNRSAIVDLLNTHDELEDVQAKFEMLDIVKVDKSVFKIITNTFKDRYYDPSAVFLNIIRHTNASNIDIIKEAVNLGYKFDDCEICESVNEYNRKFITQCLKDKKMMLSEIMDSAKYIKTEGALNFANKFISTGNFEADYLPVFLSVRNSISARFLDYVCFDKNSKIPYDKIQDIAKKINRENIDLTMHLCTDKDLDYTADQIYKIIKEVNNSDDAKIATELCTNKELSPDKVYNVLLIIKLLQRNINNFSLRQKIDLLTNLVSATPYELKLYNKYSRVDVNSLIADLSAKLGHKRDIIKIPYEQQQIFINSILANNNKAAENLLKNFDFEQFGKNGLPLKYSREEFTKNVETLLADLTPEEKQLVLIHFGLVEGAAGFDGMPTNKPFGNKDVSKKVNDIAKKIQAEIEKFTSNNQIETGDDATDRILNGLISGLPEFTSIVGKQQHGTHAYSVDIHTLKVLQSAMNNPLYENLSDIDKTILKISALCHDLGKKGGVVDEGHASASAEYVLAILDKFPFPEHVKHRIIDIVENHHWFEAYNKGRISAEDVAARCRHPEDFLIYEILAKADFENVNKDFHISNSEGVTNQAEFDKFMRDKMTAIDEALSLMYSKSNLVFDTQFMHGGEKFPREIAIVDGETFELKVLDLNKLSSNTDLQQFGFSSGVTRDNARFTVHMTKPENGNLEAVFVLTQSPLNNSAWSTSLIKYTNNRTYSNRRFGFIFDVDQANISEATYENIGSGIQKDFYNFKTILFNINNKARTYVRDSLLQELASKGIHLTDEEYVQLTKYLITKKYTTQIKDDIKIGNKVIKAKVLIKCLENSRDALFKGGDIHSEIVSINPRIKGLVAKVKKLSDCPLEFLRFAKEHDLPIVIMRPAKNESELEY